MELEYILTEKEIVALNVANDFDTKTSLEYSNVVLKKVEILLSLMNSLSEDNVKVGNHEIWSEALIYKLCFHSTTLLSLFKGVELPFKNNGLSYKVFDEPSLITLQRVITENYLTFFFLYSPNISKEEKEFRVNNWKYCGVKQRSEFDLSTEAAKKKQLEDLTTLQAIKGEIEKSSFFQNLTKKQKERLLDGKKPRLFNSWNDLIVQSGLRVKLFKKLYGYKSNYSHSEFISVMQFRTNNYSYNDNEGVHFALFLSHFLICKAIGDLVLIFPSIKKRYDLLENKMKYEIEMLIAMATNNNFDKEE